MKTCSAQRSAAPTTAGSPVPTRIAWSRLGASTSGSPWIRPGAAAPRNRSCAASHDDW
jgi:hypothetical protein